MHDSYKNKTMVSKKITVPWNVDTVKWSMETTSYQKHATMNSDIVAYGNSIPP